MQRYPENEMSLPNPPLPAFQHQTYTGLDPAQAFDVIYGGHFEHRLLSPGRTTLEHQRLVLDEFRLETGCYDFPVVARGAMPRDMVCIGLVADGAEATRYNTASIGPDEIQVYPQGVDLFITARRPRAGSPSPCPRRILQTGRDGANRACAAVAAGRRRSA